VRETSVVIVGGGPVGLALSIDLGRRGVRCMLVEQRDGSVSVPKMGLVNTRSMEFCRRWGIAERVKAAAFPRDYPGDVIYVTSMTGHELARMKFPSAQKRGRLAHTPEGKCRISQLYFDPLLKDVAATIPAVELRHRARMESFAADDEGVTVELTELPTARRETVRASYLVGCDGIESGVREALGIGLKGETYPEYHLTAFFRCPSYLSAHDKGPTIHSYLIGPEGLWGHVNAVNGRELWRLELNGLRPGTDPQSVDVHGALRRAVGAAFDYEIIAVMPWSCRQMVADRYGTGRVFLAGDAAHQNTPTGGHGMNTGLGDAVDLGWKVAATLEGWGGGRLLESYERERRPVAVRNVREAADNFERQMKFPPSDRIAEDSPAGCRQRDIFAAELRALDEVRQFDNEGIGLGYRYEPSPLCVSDGTAPPPDDAKVYRQTARPGSRAPHGWLADGRSTLDLFGAGFTLLRFADDADPTPIAAAAERRGVPLAIERIAEPEIAVLYEAPLVLVRPDGHVAWRGAAAPEDPLALIDRVRGA